MSIKIPQTFGDFCDDLLVSQQSLAIKFSPTSIPLKKLWRNNGLSANFIADYLTTFFPGESKDLETNGQQEVKSTVSYIANELLENAMKFNDRDSGYPISFGLHWHSSRIVCFTNNAVNLESAGKFQALIENLISCDPAELYISHLEKSMEEESHKTSGLGLLTLINDYSAKIGWKFENSSSSPELITVSTMVELTIS